MTAAARTYDTIARAFKVIDIAEEILVEAAPDTPAWQVCDMMDMAADGRQRNAICLVRDGRRVLGFIRNAAEECENEEGTTARDLTEQISPEMIVSAGLPVLDLIPLFRDSHDYFVLSGNEVDHVVSFQDLDKLPVKTCVFSLVMEIEDLLLAAMQGEAETFLSYLSVGRRKKASLLCRQKYGKEDPERVLHCTTFIDKKTMALSHADLGEGLPFRSRHEADRFFKKVEDTRNQIAHGESMLATLATPKEFDDLISSMARVLVALRCLPARSQGAVSL